MKTKLHFLRFSGLFLFILFVNSCSKDDENGLFTSSDASFEITVTGDESMDLTGEASFVQVVINSGDPESSGTTLTITFEDNEDTDFSTHSMNISMSQLETELFSEGTYTFNEDLEKEVYLSISFYSEASSTSYISTAGTVTLDKVTRNRVGGNLNAQFEGTNDNKITISGNFDAYGISQGWGI